jgi:hypothetical protein
MNLKKHGIYILAIILVINTIDSYAQMKPSDLTSAKHIHSKLRGNVNGEWVCKDCSDTVRIKIKKGTIDVTLDDLEVTIEKFVIGDKDVSGQFKTPITLLLSGDDYKTFVGQCSDPVTTRTIKPALQQKSKRLFSFTISYPEIDIWGDATKGTIFPKTAEFIR